MLSQYIRLGILLHAAPAAVGTEPFRLNGHIMSCGCGLTGNQNPQTQRTVPGI